MTLLLRSVASYPAWRAGVSSTPRMRAASYSATSPVIPRGFPVKGQSVVFLCEFLGFSENLRDACDVRHVLVSLQFFDLRSDKIAVLSLKGASGFEGLNGIAKAIP